MILLENNIGGFMYQVFIKTDSMFEDKKLVGEFKDLDEADEFIDAKIAKDPELKYIIEISTGSVDIYGNMITRVVREN